MQACSKPQVFYECSFHIIISQWGIDFAIVMGSGRARTAAPLGMARQAYAAAPTGMARQACCQPETEVSSGFCCPLNSTHLQEIDRTHPLIQKPIWTLPMHQT
jgi:hypothetical protein